MSLELRAADNRVAAMEAEAAIEGAAQYVLTVLSNTPAGTVPDPTYYRAEAVDVGEATFWLIGRDTNIAATGPIQLSFGLVPEASKINLNTATVDMLGKLPNMTSNLAANIFAWRSPTNRNTSGGAGTATYSALPIPYNAKNASFETIDELRLIYGLDLTYLYGEDVNLNGVLDANENDAEALPPLDNHDSILNPGLLDLVTVYSREPATTSNGTARVSVSDAGQVRQLLVSTFSGKNYNVTGRTSLLDFYNTYVKNERSRLLTEDQFAQVEPSLMNPNTNGLVNVNTASVGALACLPGIDTNNAVTLINYRQANPARLQTIGWVLEALASDSENALRAGPYITTRSYQFCADVAAVGRFGRGYRRVKFIFDTSTGTPRIVYRQDLTHLGWALGSQVRNEFLLAQAP
jgi:DNA uptake protein ComE-like DNA-binding protein